MMPEPSVCIIGDSSNILHPAYRCSFSDGSHFFGSVDEYCKYQTLIELGQQEGADALASKVEFSDSLSLYVELLSRMVHLAGVGNRLDEAFRSGQLTYMRSAYQMRFEQDEQFKRELIDTGADPILFAEGNDRELGIGMSSNMLTQWLSANHVSVNTLIVHSRSSVAGTFFGTVLGENKLGRTLMDIRDQQHASQVASVSTQANVPFDGASMYCVPSVYWENNSKVVSNFTISEQVVSLTGIFLPLSSFYACYTVVNKKHYRSVAHYVFSNWLRSWRGTMKQVQDIFSTGEPAMLPRLLTKMVSKDGEVPETRRLDRHHRHMFIPWLDVAVASKFEQHPSLKALLLATGDSLLVETVCGQSDLFLSIGLTEDELHTFVSRPHITPSLLLGWMVEPSTIPKKYVCRIGLNYSGLTLMRYREYLRSSSGSCIPVAPLEATVERPPDPALKGFSPADIVPLVEPFTLDNFAPFDDKIICFGIDCAFHPRYPSPITCPNKMLSYPSAYHFVFIEGCKFLGFPYQTQISLAKKDPANVCAAFQELIRRRFPAVSRLNSWNRKVFFERLKFACRLKFMQHPSLLRALLETGDSVLVFCHRCSSWSPELAIGMTEDDFLLWMDICQLDAGKLLGHIIQPFGRRLAFLGGNRLGILLMELRRQFRLEGTSIETIPAPTNVVAWFGEHGSEGIDEGQCSEQPALTVWPNPLVVLSKLKEVWYPSSRTESSYEAAELQSLSDNSENSKFEWLMDIVLDALEEIKELRLAKENMSSSIRGKLDALAVHNAEMIEREKGLMFITKSVEKEQSESASSTPSGAQNIPKLHLDPVVNKQVFLLEAGFVNGLRESANVGSALLKLDWGTDDMKKVAARTWYHLTELERSKALVWLKHTVESLREKLDKRRPVDLRHFVSVEPVKEIKWLQPAMINSSVDLLEDQSWQMCSNDDHVVHVDFCLTPQVL
uniref:NADAR domain-containing protein n=1 Tax=Trichuris muris TaxID=70415 RepID=A0A5S6QMF8_TRIMR